MRKNILLFSKKYFKFIFVKWKILIFLIAFFILCFVAGLGLDPTWDIPETIIMSLLTFITAPYSIGVIYRYLKGYDKIFSEFYVAIILLFFSSAWFYDIYAMIFLLGEYPMSAFSNLLLSPFFYIFAGIIWNMGVDEKDGVILYFMDKKWIDSNNIKNDFGKIWIYILPFIIFMVIIFGYFLYLNI